MTKVDPPGLAARLVVGSLATLGLFVACCVMAVVITIALVAGVPTWGVALGVVVTVGCVLIAATRVRRAARATAAGAGGV